MCMKTVIACVVLMLLAVVPGWTQEIDTTSSIVCILPVESLPEYPGGWGEYKNFVQENLKYPFRRTCMQGIVFISFTVCEDGSLTDFTVAKGLCKECDENALEALRKMPPWKPATTEGGRKPIARRITLPVKIGVF
jgi:TonB family protein